MTYSQTVELVWRKGAAIAKQRHTLIEPEYILHSVLSLDCEADPLVPETAQCKAELSEVTHAFETNGVRFDDAAAQLYSQIECVQPSTSPLYNLAGHISRSATCKDAFSLADDAASKEGLPQAHLRHLAGGIIRCLKDTHSSLGVDEELAGALITSLWGPQDSRPNYIVIPGPEAATTDVILSDLDASRVLKPTIEWNEVGPKLASLCELTWEFGSNGNIEKLLKSATEKILTSIPHATDSAILIIDPQSGKLLLKAHSPPGDVSVSTSSANVAIRQKKAFIWRRQKDLSRSQLESSFESGIYAPIIAEDNCFGVVCLNTESAGLRLTAEDLFLTASFGHQIGLVYLNMNLKAQIAEKVKILERLMTNFSPQIRAHLIKRAQAGRLKLGGERSDVSMLFADIRGFTLMAREMDTDDLIQLLNDYFAEFVECVFKHEGTVERFIGDALLVVFGSPERHPRHTEQATRAAVALQAGARAVSERRRMRGDVTCEIGIGVHTGEVIHGFVGSEDHMEFTIIGDAANMTSRHCSAAGPSEIVISTQVYEKLWNSLKVEAIQVATKHEGTLDAYRLLSFRGV